MPKLLLPIAAVLAVGAATAGGATYVLTRGDTVEEVPPPAVQATVTPSPAATETPAAPTQQTVLVRSLDVTMEIPTSPDVKQWYELGPGEVFYTPSGLLVGRGDPGFSIYSEHSERVMAIDARTGAVTKDTLDSPERAAANPLLESVRVSPFDPKTLPWPYNGEPPDVPRQKFGGITYIPPHPSAGIVMIAGVGDPSGEWSLEVTNGRSRALVNVDRGTYWKEPGLIVPEDEGALVKFIALMDYSGEPLKPYEPES